MLNFWKESLKLGEMQRGKNFLRWQVGPSSDNTTEPLNTASQQRHRSPRTILPEIFFNCTILELYHLHSLTISNHGSQEGPRQAQVGQGGRRQGTSQTPTDNGWTFTDFLLDIWHEKCTVTALIPILPPFLTFIIEKRLRSPETDKSDPSCFGICQVCRAEEEGSRKATETERKRSCRAS